MKWSLTALVKAGRRGLYVPGTKYNGIFKYQNHAWPQSPTTDKFPNFFLSYFKFLALYLSPKPHYVTLLLQQPLLPASAYLDYHKTLSRPQVLPLLLVQTLPLP